jgi:hypothetical protein
VSFVANEHKNPSRPHVADIWNSPLFLPQVNLEERFPFRDADGIADEVIPVRRLFKRAFGALAANLISQILKIVHMTESD